MVSVISLPATFIYERFVLSRQEQSPFVRQAAPFEDFAVRCVRYAFANIPATIGRVFFSKPVALPFLRFRMLRHGYFRSPIHWHEVSLVGLNNPLAKFNFDRNMQGNAKGLWITSNQYQKPDIVIYYAHGMSFSCARVRSLTILNRRWILYGF